MRVLTLGTFDMPHPGHLELFKWCADIAGPGAPGWVAVAVNTDEFVTRFKTAPRYSLEERMAMVNAIKGVDEVVTNSGRDQPALILSLRPDVLVIGSDWARKDYLAQLEITQDWLDEKWIALTYVPRSKTWSSTQMRARGES